ncbi:MAG: hypothetical protein MZW92_11995 [Comamonadaceae bacterium]|nr:hypothetical protein [Comamonadaceae bacterium]
MHDALQLALILLGRRGRGRGRCSARLQLPPILGYLLVGVAIGPHALGLVADAPRTCATSPSSASCSSCSRSGLEFSLPQLHGDAAHWCSASAARRWRSRSVAGRGRWRWLARGLSAGRRALVAGRRARDVLDRHRLQAAGRAAAARTRRTAAQIMGVLLFQDLAVVPLLVLIPALALPRRGARGTPSAWRLLKAAVVLAVVAVRRAAPDAPAGSTLVAQQQVARSSSCSTCCWSRWASPG